MSNIQTLFKHTFVYGLSSVAGKGINYLLMPIHTYSIGAATGQYSIVTRLYAATALLTLVLTFGMETAMFRYLNKEGEDKQKVYSTIVTFIGLLSSAFALFVVFFRNPIADGLGYSDITLGVMSIFLAMSLDAFQSIPLAYLRQNNRPLKYMSIYVGKISIIVLLNFLYFIVFPKFQINFLGIYSPEFELNVVYVFYINLIGSIVSTLLLYHEISIAQFLIDKKLMKKLLRYSWPIVLLGIAGQINKSADKLLYPYLDTSAQSAVNLSIYGGVVKIAAIMTMLTQAFRNAYEPIVFGNVKDKNNKDYQAKAMKFYLIFMLLAFLSVMAFLNILRYLLGGDYWEGLFVVPILMTSEIIFGVYYNLSMWYKLIDQTYWGALFSGFACLIYIIILFIFVPIYGYVACALASLVANTITMSLSYFVGRIKNPINYPIRDILCYVILATILALAMLYSNKYLPAIAALFVNALLLIPFMIYLFKKDISLSGIKTALAKRRTSNA